MNSLHRRLQLGILGGVAIALAAGFVAAHAILRARLRAELDESLAEKSETVVASISQELGAVELDWLDYEADPPGFAAGADYFLVENLETGEVLAASPGFADWSLLETEATPELAEPHDAALPGYREGRSIVTVFNARVEIPDEDESAARHAAVPPPATAPVGGARIKLIIASVDDVDETMLTMTRFLTVLWIACVALVGLVVQLVVRRGLRPLDALGARIQGLDEKAPKKRVEFPDPPRELVPVIDELNRLLDRVEQALTRERTLTSNVAHELRTPIAGLLSILEVTLGHLRSREEYRDSTQECFEIAKRMHWLVSNLLSVARIEANNVELQRRRIDLHEALEEWWQPFAEPARERRIEIVWDIGQDLSIETDPEFLRVVVANLFDNATSYTPDGGIIRISADTDRSIAVANQTVELRPEAAEHLFDPYWRDTEARENAGAHAGLGLSLCRKIVELLGGSISAAIKESEALFVVRIEMS